MLVLIALYATMAIASPAQTFDKHFNLNARAVYFTVQKALPLLTDNGSIILSGSAAWQMGIPGYGAYSATKAALPETTGHQQDIELRRLGDAHLRGQYQPLHVPHQTVGFSQPHRCSNPGSAKAPRKDR